MCFSGGSPANPGECHEDCFAEEEEEDYQLAYSQLVRSAVDGETQHILALASVAWKHVALNEDRQSLQLFDCRHRFLVANVPLSETDMALARTLLDRPRPNAETDAGGIG
jgi:hypothetical protein